jgi:hypothetical protein
MSNDLPTGLDPRYDDYEDHDDMPFAVDTAPASMTTTPDASAVVASFASTKRLALFDSHHHAQPPKEEDVMSSLADQLAEFKSFGASLMVESTTS